MNQNVSAKVIFLAVVSGEIRSRTVTLFCFHAGQIRSRIYVASSGYSILVLNDLFMLNTDHIYVFLLFFMFTCPF